MSQEHVEMLLRLTQAFNRGDLDDGLRCMDPEVVLYPGLQVPDEEARYVGHKGMEEWFRSVTDAWGSVAVERREIVEGAGDRYLVVNRWSFRGRDGIELELDLPTVFTIRDGLIVRIDGFADRAEALEELGRGDGG